MDEATKDVMHGVSPDLQCVDPSEACLLGSPIGGQESIDVVLKSKEKPLKLLGERLKLLHSHDALCLLRNALALPKILYVLCTAPCFLSTILSNLDNLQRSLLEAVCNVSLSDRSRSQASLPIRVDGLVIRNFTMLATSAFLASAAGSSSLLQRLLPPSLATDSCPFKVEALALWSQGHDSQPPTGVNASKQRDWDTPHIDTAISSLLSSADNTSRARLLASQQKEAGAWLSALPRYHLLA